MRNIIFINADDFGLDNASNEKISYCLLNNLISSTTLITNMPGFEDAVERTHKYNFNGRVGVHFNLFEGKPLSDQMYHFLKGNTLDNLRLKHFYNKIESEVIYQELKTQLLRIFVQGIVPSHIDSHHNTHKYYGILKAIIRFSNEYSISYIRNTRNIYIENNNIKKSLLKRFYQTYFKCNKIHSSKYFTSLYPYVSDDSKLLNIELMCHPGGIDEFEFLCSETYRRFLNENQGKIVFKGIFSK